MVANVKQSFAVNQQIQNHVGWLGQISGIQAEKMLREYKIPYLYVLRSGENKTEDSSDYYVTYIDFDNNVRHQPFTIVTSTEGWYYVQGGTGGPFQNTTIDEVLHLIMHCRPNESQPLSI